MSKEEMFGEEQEDEREWDETRRNEGDRREWIAETVYAIYIGRKGAMLRRPESVGGAHKQTHKEIILREGTYLYVPGIDLPRSRYSRTDGLRNPGGTTGASFVGLFLSSTGSS